MIFVAALALAAVSPKTPFAACIRKNVPSLEVSGERPDDVASAAWQICKGDFEGVVNGLTDSSPEKTARVMEYAKVRLIPAIATHVVRMRACRKTPGCAVTRLSWEEGL